MITQRGGRTESSDESSGPLVAAYDAGRMLNQLEWHLQQSWLLPAIKDAEAEHHARAVPCILGDLAPRLRPALTVEAAMQLHECLLAQRDEWDRAFGSQWHQDEIEDRSSFIRYELAQDRDVSPCLVLEENWRVALHWVVGFASAVLQSTIAKLNGPRQRAVELGRWIDRGVHPRAAYRYMCRWTRNSPVEPSSGNGPWLGEYDHISSPSGAEAAPPVLYPITEGTIPPEPGWLDQIRHCWREMGLPGAVLESFVQQQREACASGIEAGVGSCIASLDRLVRDELADMTPQEKIPPDERTKPMTLREAAQLMKIGRGKKGADCLRGYIDDGTVECEKLSRQRYVFKKSAFPSGVWGKIT